ncbi:MAG: TylF/MycF/NovP-related O-methyltransferase [Nocardioidaceae bacterium]
MTRVRPNDLLHRWTGFRLVKSKPPARLRGSRVGNIRKDVDDQARRRIEQVAPRTMTGPVKLYGLILAVRHIADRGIPGDIVECGVWRGGSMQAAALTLLERGVTDRDLHLFDTFEGMTAPTDRDRRNDGTTAQHLLDRNESDSPVWAVAGEDDVRAGMAETGYPAEHVHLHRGPVETTIPDQAPARIALLRLDTDWYESTKHELRHLYDRLTPGGVLIIDDYGHWEGSRAATDEFLDKTEDRPLLLPLGSGRIAIKPGR